MAKAKQPITAARPAAPPAPAPGAHLDRRALTPAQDRDIDVRMERLIASSPTTLSLSAAVEGHLDLPSARAVQALKGSQIEGYLASVLLLRHTKDVAVQAFGAQAVDDAVGTVFHRYDSPFSMSKPTGKLVGDTMLALGIGLVCGAAMTAVGFLCVFP